MTVPMPDTYEQQCLALNNAISMIEETIARTKPELQQLYMIVEETDKNLHPWED